MKLVNGKVEKNEKLARWFEQSVDGYSFNDLMRALRNRDVKINGVRVNADIKLTAGDNVEIYLPEKSKVNVEIVFEDDNIIVVNKPTGVLSVDDNGTRQTMESVVNQLCPGALPVHRLDRNTAGLMIFAKSQKILDVLIKATKAGEIGKSYLAWVYGKFPEKVNSEAYLFSDKKQARSIVSAVKKQGYEQIKTDFKLIKTNGEVSLVEAKLHSGKLHQVRAHLAFLGYALVGDGLYAKHEDFNKTKQKHHQLLAYKIEFKLNKNNVLSYLNNCKVELKTQKFSNIFKI